VQAHCAPGDIGLAREQIELDRTVKPVARQRLGQLFKPEHPRFDFIQARPAAQRIAEAQPQHPRPFARFVDLEHHHPFALGRIGRSQAEPLRQRQVVRQAEHGMGFERRG
jgi:hypothetical protein